MNWYKSSMKRDCFGEVARAATHGGKGLPKSQVEAMDEVKIVHGTVIGHMGQRMPHSWLEMKTGNWWFCWESQNGKMMNKDSYYRITKAQPDYYLETHEHALLTVKSGTPGPFTEDERKVIIASKNRTSLTKNNLTDEEKEKLVNAVLNDKTREIYIIEPVIASKKDDKMPITPEERAEIKDRFGETECSFWKDKKGFFCRTHRARSDSYKNISDIPEEDVDFISSTS